ncbi:hypothetical protein EDB84DRAFT_639690 [Lactarius hengduanensis]|nr:hypothetical protein EDB84DRAFT_639690 [Lactarius hengduanensis]
MSSSLHSLTRLPCTCITRSPWSKRARLLYLMMSRGGEVFFAVEIKTRFKNRHYRKAGEGTDRGGCIGFFIPRYFRLTTVLQHKLKLKIEGFNVIQPFICPCIKQSILQKPYRHICDYNSTDFFNTLPRQSSHYLLVYNAPLGSASTDDELQRATGLRTDVEKWLKEVFSKAGASRQGQPLQAQAHSLARPRIAIATALSYPTKFNAVLAEQAYPLVALFLQMFFSRGPDNLHAWQQAHADISGEFGS